MQDLYIRVKNMVGYLLLNILASFLFSVSTADVETILLTPSGIIEGKTVYYNRIPVRAYLGIPYAKPPTGDLRFKKPVPLGRWDGVKRAITLPPPCVQYSTLDFPTTVNITTTTLDCLYLNIWAPAAATGRSVMFWIHGGGFTIGTGSSRYYDSRALVAEGDVIVVTINYRLGAEGFFYSGTTDAPGNMGMWDIVEALKWVRRNIYAFGGNENSITLFGHSAGGFASGMLCTSPITKGLFKRVILQSGAPTIIDENVNRTVETSKKLAVAVGCAATEDELYQNPEEVVECMRGTDPYETATTLISVTSRQYRTYYPRYGDDLLPKSPRQAFIDGDFIPVDLFIGTNNGDGALYVAEFNEEIFGSRGEKDPQINRTLGASIIKKDFQISDFSDPDAVVRQYLGDVADDDYYKIRFQVFTAQGDYMRECPSNYLAESFAKKGANAYSYFFTHRPKNSIFAPWMLAVHFDEVPFEFGYPLLHPEDYTSDEEALSKRMVLAWSNFAKMGKPEREWPLYSKQNPTYVVLDTNTSTTGTGPHEENCEFFRPYFGF